MMRPDDGSWSKVRTRSPERRTRSRQSRARQGASLAELLVAAVLLITCMSLVGTGFVSIKRLVRDGREHRLAVTTLSNLLEQALATQDAPENLSDLQLPPELVERLEDARLQSRLIEDEQGSRIELELNWLRPGATEPLVLVGWLRPPGKNDASASDRSLQQEEGQADS